MQSLLTIENIKVLFILATGLYSYTFLRRYRSGKERERKMRDNEEAIKRELDCMADGRYEVGRIYRVMRGLADGEGDGELGKGEEQVKESQGQQPEDIDQEIDQIMGKYLLQKMSNTKTLSQIRAQRNIKSQFPANQMHAQQSESELEHQLQRPGFKRIKSCTKNIVKLEDAIAHIEGPRGKQNFEFIPPYIEKMEIEEHPSFEQALRNKKLILTNEYMLTKYGPKDANASTCTTLTQNARTKTKPIPKYRKKSKINLKKNKNSELLKNKRQESPRSPEKINRTAFMTPRKTSSRPQKFYQCQVAYDNDESLLGMMEEEPGREKCQPELDHIPKQGLYRIIRTQIRYEYTHPKKPNP